MSASPAVSSASLPAPLTGFVGRERELLAVHRLMGEARLLTLTGAGGSGKTRLALALASRLAEEDGGPEVAWVELGSLTDAPSLPTHLTLALALGAH